MSSGPSSPAISSPPRVSIGLPIYNGADYAAVCLDSLLSQRFEDFEIVISDNASTDETGDICRSYAERDSRIRYIRQPENKGVAYNFRTVFEHARAPYFKWATHDDLCLPGYLGACVGILDSTDESVVLAYPRTILIDENGDEVEPYEDRMDMRERRPSERLRHQLQKLRFCHCGLGLIRRTALERTRLIDGFESSDVVMLAELALLGEFHEHPEFLYQRRIHGGSSFGAYSDALAYAARMDPARKSGPLPMPRTRLYVEITRSIFRAPIPAREKLRSHRILLENWGPRFWRVIGGEFKRRLRWDLDRISRRRLSS